MHSISRPRKSKALSLARSSFALNPDFGYLNSQVPDENAFRYHLGAPAGEETQVELGLAHTTSPGDVQEYEAKPTIAVAHGRPIIIKNEDKENIALDLLSRPPSTKRARVESSVRVKTEEGTRLVPVAEPASAEPAGGDRLRISQLEKEVLLLRHEIAASHEARERDIEDLQREWRNMLTDCKYFQSRVKGFGIRLFRVEDRVDEIAAQVPGYHGSRSGIGSEYDPDTTFVEEDGSQPVEGLQEWSAGSYMDEGKEING
ncbi:hypothetical protein B0H17DRAFT_1219041 [Mycena rosella]|uniref:Uncharacterized protein n=1 Tax=Mycena rosella TaxID=1033263 RepID=A0AAD7BKP9_MYCRO|nr:hypothetical protein B0H17DRAFT_1219041 [Mycena rosella]